MANSDLSSPLKGLPATGNQQDGSEMNQSYDEHMERILDSAGREEEEEDEDFDDFVYAGKDAQLEQKDSQAALPSHSRDYSSRLADVLETEPERKAVDLDLGGTSQITTFKRNGVAHSAASPTPSRYSSASNDTFPRVHSPFKNPSAPRRPSFHPQISRLRSMQTQPQNRFISSSSYQTAYEHFPSSGIPLGSPGTSVGIGSRRSSASNLFEGAANGTSISEVDLSSQAEQSEQGIHSPAESLKWSTLKRVSSRVYPNLPHPNGSSPSPTAANLLENPSVMAVSGIIAIGTTKGWVMVFDFGQNLRCVCGTEQIANEAGAVTAVAISQDHTFIAVGHERGSIHLYNLVQPAKPSRSVLPTSLQLVRTGKKEGHLNHTKILHLGFVGARHTAIVSSDELGLGFYHTLGKVLGMASVDIIRMLGRYPETEPSAKISTQPNGANPVLDTLNGTPVKGSKKPATILDMAPLPLGTGAHCIDSHALVAMLTKTKLVIVGLKPSPRTWWRATPSKNLIQSESSNFATLCWWPSCSNQAENAQPRPGEFVLGENPLLAFSWASSIRLVEVKPAAAANPQSDRAKVVDVEFIELSGWQMEANVIGLRWYNQKVLFVITPDFIEVYDVTTQTRLGREALTIREIISSEISGVGNYSANFLVHKKKMFALTDSELRVGAILSWADRILSLMQNGLIPEAIELTTNYLLGQIDASTINLPRDAQERKLAVEPKLREILSASLEFVFSEDRLRDGTHADGEAMQTLFHNLVGACVGACIGLNDFDWLFDDLYEKFEQNGIQEIFLQAIEPFVLGGQVEQLPPTVSQRLIAIHEQRGQFDAVQRIICHVDPQRLDLNQALNICQRQHLYDALIHVYTRAMHDYIAPIVELITLIKKLVVQRNPAEIDVDENPFQSAWQPNETANSTNDAYKIFAYLSAVLTGNSYPTNKLLPESESILARNSIYKFLFSAETRFWPERGGKPILVSDDSNVLESDFPYLVFLLRFDAEAFLDALDLAFEEFYFDDEIKGKSVTRQSIINTLLPLVQNGNGDTSSQLSSLDLTFLRIFIARNLPKYPQYIKLPADTIEHLIVVLTNDSDQSTNSDRELAVEFLLSCHFPSHVPNLIELFERAKFYKILRSIYKNERNWANLAKTFFNDEEIGDDVFHHLRETLRLAKKANRAEREILAETILQHVPNLIEADKFGLQRTAKLFEDSLPEFHAAVLDKLAPNSFRQFAYLRFLLEPDSTKDLQQIDFGDSAQVAPSQHLNSSQRLQYLSLLCQHESDHVIRYLEFDPTNLFRLDEALEICKGSENFDAQIWITERQGHLGKALELVDDSLETRTDLVIKALQDDAADDDQDENFRYPVKIDFVLEQIAAINRVAIQICVKHSQQAGPRNKLTAEDVWYSLLASLVEIVRSVNAASENLAESSEKEVSTRQRRISTGSIILHEDAQHEETVLTRVQNCVNLLIPSALSALVSSTNSRQVSFPNLMRKLISNQSARGTTKTSARPYKQLKIILNSMLETYKSEAELLSLTAKISSQDLFEHVNNLKRGRELGWRAQRDLCHECGQPVWGPEGVGSSPPMSRSASVSMVVDSLKLSGRPRMKKRPSLKGKEVDPLELHETNTLKNSYSTARVHANPSGLSSGLDPPKGIVIGRDGKVCHEICLLRGNFQGGLTNSYRMDFSE